MKGMKIGIFGLALMLGLASCGSEGDGDVSKPIDGANVQTNNETPAADQKMDPAKTADDAATPAGPTTSMSFDEYAHDFGTINEGDKVTHIFTFTNTGTEPLILDKCKGSCGCTVPTCPKEPIAPGATGEIEVSFNSKGKPNKQTKKVTITANTDPVQTYLTIKADVIPAAPAE